MNSTKELVGRSAVASRSEIMSPKDPRIADRLRETLNYLNELAEVQADTRRALVGPEPSSGEIGKRDSEPSIEELLGMVCEKSAIAVSDAKSIFARL